MKKLLLLVLGLIIIYLGLQACIKFFGNGHSEIYIINNDKKELKIQEKYYQKIDEMKNHYDFTISVDKLSFSFSIYENFNRDNQIIKNVYYYKDKEYTCVLPIFKGEKLETDLMCMKESIIYPYHIIKGKDKKLDTYVSKIDLYGENVFYDDKTKFKETDSLKVFVNNLNDNELLALNNYKGVYLINDTISNIKLFKSDAYTQKLNYIVDNKYVVANYDCEYDFNSIYIVNMKNGDKTLMKTPEISFDSYIQGVIDNSIYLIDKSNKKQFQLDINDDKVYEIGNENKGTKYYDGKSLINKTMIQTLNNQLEFANDFKKEFDDYIEIGNSKTKYYIYFKKVDNGYDIYKSYSLNKNLIYLFHVSDYKQVTFIDDYIYLIEGNNLIRYNDYSGKKTLLINSEFDFNDNLYYYVYHK